MVSELRTAVWVVVTGIVELVYSAQLRLQPQQRFSSMQHCSSRQRSTNHDSGDSTQRRLCHTTHGSHSKQSSTNTPSISSSTTTSS